MSRKSDFWLNNCREGGFSHQLPSFVVLGQERHKCASKTSKSKENHDAHSTLVVAASAECGKDDGDNSNGTRGNGEECCLLRVVAKSGSRSVKTKAAEYSEI